jgi:hypothetical protein
MGHGSTYAEVSLTIPASDGLPEQEFCAPIAVFGIHAGIDVVSEAQAEFGSQEPLVASTQARPPIALYGKELHQINVGNPNITAYTIRTPARAEEGDGLESHQYAGLFDRFAFGFARQVDEHVPERMHSGISAVTIVAVKGALKAFDISREVRERVLSALTE